MGRSLLVGLIATLCLAGQSEAANLSVRLIQEVSNDQVWQFEVVNASVDALDVQQLTVTFLADGHRLWAVPVALAPRILQPGESGWVTLETRYVPRVRPLQMNWDLTWNPHGVPVLHQFWRTERVASLELEPAPGPSGAVSRAAPPVPESPLEAPTRRF